MKMVVAGDSSERAIELMRRMEDSRHFRDTQIDNQQTILSPQSTDTVQFTINALYVPSIDPANTLDQKRTR